MTTPETPMTPDSTTTPPPFFYLPCVQTRAEGGFFNGFNAASTASTSPASKRELEVDLSGISTCLAPPPPPSHPNASRSWTFQRLQSCCHRFHLPRVQTRARSEFLWRFDATLGGYSSRGIRQCETHTPPCSNVFPTLWAPGAARNFIALFATPK